jgi:hypothetical protein
MTTWCPTQLLEQLAALADTDALLQQPPSTWPPKQVQHAVQGVAGAARQAQRCRCKDTAHLLHTAAAAALAAVCQHRAPHAVPHMAVGQLVFLAHNASSVLLYCDSDGGDRQGVKEAVSTAQLSAHAAYMRCVGPQGPLWRCLEPAMCRKLAQNVKARARPNTQPALSGRGQVVVPHSDPRRPHAPLHHTTWDALRFVQVRESWGAD